MHSDIPNEKMTDNKQENYKQDKKILKEEQYMVKLALKKKD